MFEHVTAPEIITALCAVATLVIYFTASLIGAVVALYRKLDATRDDILKDVQEKHEANRVRYDALNVLVMRHDLVLNPEFSDNGRHSGQGSRHGR